MFVPNIGDWPDPGISKELPVRTRVGSPRLSRDRTKKSWHSRRMLCFIFIIIVALSLQGVQSFFYNGSSNDPRPGFCGVRSVRQAEFNWNSPERSMTESFVLEDVEYRLSRYRVTWDEALVFCSSHRAHLATLDSEEKTAFVVQAIASSSSVSEDYWIGATKLFDNPWRWSSNGMRLTFESDIVVNLPITYPGFDSNDIHCLTIDRSGHDEPIFVPRACNQRRGFICQRDTDRTFDSKIRMVAASRIGEQEFRLYAGRATWTEAVVQCRQEGLQIAEVNTVEEARTLGLAMLRNRPEGIESAWIGGYTRNDEPSTWRWLASGQKISNSQMWRKNVSESSGGCLLLDRHICESPVYVKSTCERKRDILCQKPPKKRANESPMAVLVDDCPYWIGFFPLKWSDARRSCQALNASLVVLDSPATISHMMSLMLDNKADLRHIWTDGTRSKIDGQWKWFVTGESIPSIGESFVPWCPEDDYYTKESGCLNLDRENLDTPLVYGLPCREKQPYVCQPRAGACVFHPAPDVSSDASEDVESRPAFDSPPFLYEDSASLSTSTVTTSYPTLRDSYAVLQTTISIKSDLLAASNSNDSFVKKNSSSHPNFAQFLRPLARFTLPTLPQFGIKLVSATEATTNSPSFTTASKKSKSFKFPTTSPQPSNPTTLSPPSSLSITVKKIPSDVRKASKPSSEFPATLSTPPTSPDQSETTPATEQSPEITDPTSPLLPQASPIPKPLWTSKNPSKSSNAPEKSSSTSDEATTTKRSAKTTRDLSSSNPTKEAATTTTTKAPNVPIGTAEKKPKFSLKSAPRNSTFGGRRLNVHVDPESTTPYDAVDEDYYDDDKPTKKKPDEDSGRKNGNEDNNQSDEYSEDYETKTTGKSSKKSKQTSESNLRRNNENVKNAEKEASGEDEDYDEESTNASVPIAAELSKHLESALVDMITDGMDKNKQKVTTAEGKKLTKENKKHDKIGNGIWLGEESEEPPRPNAKKATNFLQNPPRPYYMFEGPLASIFPGYAHLRYDDNRQFMFLGKKINNENFQLPKPGDRTSGKQSQLRARSQQPSERRDFPVSMSGMPDFRPEDPKSLMQLGHFFKNKFQGFAQNARRTGEGIRVKGPRDEGDRIGRRRFGPQGRLHPQGRVRERPAKREQAEVAIERQRPAKREEAQVAIERQRPAKREQAQEAIERQWPAKREQAQVAIERQQPAKRQQAHVVIERQWPAKRKQAAVAIEQQWPAKREEAQVAIERQWPAKREQAQVVIERQRPAKREQAQVVIERQRPAKREQAQVVIERQRPAKREQAQVVIERQRPAKREEAQVAIERQRESLERPKIEPSYHEEARRLYTRENYKVGGFVARQGDERTLKEQQQRLDVAWPDKNYLNRSNFAEGPAASHQKLPLSVRTARSFRETSKRGKVEAIDGSPFPEFKLSKLVKEVRIDLDQRMLRRYLEGFAKKIVGKSSGATGDDWKKTWRVLLEQMLSVLNRMNVNVNGDVMKLRVGEQGEEILLGPYKKNPKDSKKQSKPSASVGNKNSADKSKKPIETAVRKSNNSTRTKNPTQTISKAPTAGKTTTKSPPGVHKGKESSATKFGAKTSLNNKGAAALPEDNSRQLSNRFQAKFTNQTNSRKAQSSQEFTPVSRFPTVFRLHPLDPQLQPATAFQPARNQIFGSAPGSFDAEYSPETAVGDDYANSTLEPDYNSTYVDWDSEGVIVDEEENRGEENREAEVPEDYEQRPSWSSTHRLSKALELSVLRKFGASPSSALISKRLVTRSVKKIEAPSGGRKIVETLENLQEEPSIISLSMKVMPEKKSSRIMRQSKGTPDSEPNSRSLEVSVQFSGKEEPRDSSAEQISNTQDSKLSETKNSNVRGNKASPRSLPKNSPAKGKSPKAVGTTKRPIRFVDKERRRAMVDRLQDQSRSVKKNYIRSYATSKINATSSSGRKNTLSDAGASKRNPEAKHRLATSLRSFDEKKKGGKSRGSEPGIDWTNEASALFADLKESSDDLTLYIDLTLGRVGSKPRNGKSRGKP